MRVLVVCLGNAYRSPAAEAVIREHAPAGTEVSSAGFSPHKTTAPRMRRALAERGYTMGTETTLLTREMVVEANVIIYMTPAHLRRILTMFPYYASRRRGTFELLALGRFADPPVERIPDPGFIPLRVPGWASTVDLIVDAARRYARSLSSC